MEAFNGSELLFRIVVDTAGHVLGTVTDGDVRRAILQGKSTSALINECMWKNPKIVQSADDPSIPRLLQDVPFVPLVDDEGVLQYVAVETSAAQGVRTALIMAGGFGKRLGKLTRDRPKPLVTVGDKPILDHVLTLLETADVEEIYISVHHMAEQIERFVGKRENRSNIHLVEESKKLGTAGALGLLPPSSHPVLIFNADVVSSTDLLALHLHHERRMHDATIAVAKYDVPIPYGVVRQNDDGLFLRIDEKPVLSNFIAAGIYYLSPEFQSLITQGDPIDMPDLLNLGRMAGLTIGLFPIHEYWIDVGRPEELSQANRDWEAGS